MFKTDNIHGRAVEPDVQFAAVQRDVEFTDAVLMRGVLTAFFGEQWLTATGQQQQTE